MPFYLFTNGVEVKEIFFHMTDEKKYSENNIVWVRLFTSPNTSIDSRINPLSPKEFVDKTRKKGSIGDLWDISKELSIKREELCGKDHIKENYERNWSKHRKGKKLPYITQQKAKDKLNKLGILVED